MENSNCKSMENAKVTIHSRRGDIKLRIFREIGKSAISAFSAVGRLGGKKGENGVALTSSSTTPHETPSGYSSDGHFDG
ncbi:hypothetical protein U1Q18_020937 [Sarracenia purpurea var. burkii]